ncbi:MAG: type IX secretion system sortase PorU [Flavobacteriales bacterium]
MFSSFKPYLFFVFCLALSSIYAQDYKFSNDWNTAIKTVDKSGRTAFVLPGTTSIHGVPHALHFFDLEAHQSAKQPKLEILNYSPVLVDDSKVYSANELKIETETVYKKGKAQLQITFPLIVKGKKIETYKLSYTLYSRAKKTAVFDYNPPTYSPLKEGDWYKIKTIEQGVYKLTANKLQELGLDMTNIQSDKIRLFGQNKGMLSEANADERPLGLMENAISVVDGGDGVFSGSDYILFYSGGAHRWDFDQSSKTFSHQTHLYADEAYYFLNFNDKAGKRINLEPNANATNPQQVNHFDALWFHELEAVNVKNTGKKWFGERFEFIKTYNFQIPDLNRVQSDSVYIKLSGVARSQSNSQMRVKQGNDILLSMGIAATGNASNEVNGTVKATKQVVSGSNLNFDVVFDDNNVSGAFAYLDYLEVNFRDRLEFSNHQSHFRDVQSYKNGGFAQFNFTSSSSELNIWDVTNHTDIKQMSTSNTSFVTAVDELKTFVAFAPDQALSISELQAIDNQNLHGLSETEYLILYHPDFQHSAEELAVFHQTTFGTETKAINIEHIYNEFSSGRQDISAIRDFIRMLYNRYIDLNKAPKNVLLFGDASFDYKDRIDNNTNYVPTWTSEFSYNIKNSVSTDDFFVLMDENEGSKLLGFTEYTDLGIGRFVVATTEEAQAAVSKSKHYVNPEHRGVWQSRLSLVTDDVDEGWERGLTLNANKIISEFGEQFPVFNLNKIYADAHTQTNSSGGQRYPTVSSAIDRAVEDGSLIVHYYGHGGEVGWASERILSNEQINSWQNLENMPVFITTTCEFTRYDDAKRISAGEYVHLNPKGGGIALYTSTRELNTSDAKSLSTEFYRHFYEGQSSGNQTMGELMYKIKTNYADSNKRRFILIGDPNLRFNLPQHKVQIDKINGLDATLAQDPIEALSLMKIEGSVIHANGNFFSSFNGIADVSVYDKRTMTETLNNDQVLDFQGNVIPSIAFEIQKNKIFKGKVEVVDGLFEVEFMVPKDINLEVDTGKISIFATTYSGDEAWGANTGIQVGGLNQNAAEDNKGPDIQLFMNDSSFVFGGVTGHSPDIFAVLSDENGINAVGTGLGHDITAVVDAASANPIILNNFYQTHPNTFQSGEVRYPLSDLDEGMHTLTLKAWDNYNNSNAKEIEFLVSTDGSIALNDLFNYPNPFSDQTYFYFGHNKQGQELAIQLDIYTLTGLLVHSVKETISNSPSNVDGALVWDGTDHNGNKLPNGTYLYKLSVNQPESEKKEHKVNKLVIIK